MAARLRTASAAFRQSFQLAVRLVQLLVWIAATALGAIVGRLAWEPPGWVRRVGAGLRRGAVWVRSHPRQAGIALGSAVGVLLLAAGIKLWYDSLPKPVELTVRVDQPALTRYDVEEIRPNPLRLVFSDSAALLKLVGKEVAEGIRIAPGIDGRWQWRDDRTLEFMPRLDWPVGQRYEVTLARQGVVAAHVRIAERTFEFSTAPFKAGISEADFYQDPTDPNLKKVVLTLAFSHPVDPAELERRVSMSLESREASLLNLGGEAVKFSVSFDPPKLKAYVHSQPLKVPEDDAQLRATIKPGVRAARGGPASQETLERTVAIPSLNSLKVASADLILVNNERAGPEQVLAIAMTAEVHEKEIQKSVEAFVLPVRDSTSGKGDEANPYDWDDVVKIDTKILAEAQKLKLEGVAAEREHSVQHRFKLNADVGRYIYVKVSRGVQSFGGYRMARDFARIVRVQPFPAGVRIMHEGALLALSGERKLTIYAHDVRALRYEIGRLVPNQVQHLVTQTSGDFSHPQFRSSDYGEDDGNYGGYGIDESALTERFARTVRLPKTAPGKPHYEALDLGEYLDESGAGRRGVFMLTVRAVDPDSEQPMGEQDRRMVVLTDLGIVVKKALDGSQDVYVQSIHDGDPVSGASVEVLGRNGMPVLTQSTDAGGHARFPALTGYRNEKAPVVYVVRKGSDFSFLPLDREDRTLDLSRFDVGGVENRVSPESLTAFLFSDRGIYRPGDEIRVGLIVKAADWSRGPTGLPVEAEIVDPRGLLLKRMRLRLPASGFEELRYTTLETSPTGIYTINLYIVRDDKSAGQIGSVSVRVNEFLPDRMKMSARLSAESNQGWVSPDGLTALVDLQNLFGTPAANRRVTAVMTLTPTYPSFSRYPDYAFYDPMRARQSFTEDLDEVETDDDGKAELELGLDRYAGATYHLHIVAQGFEAQGGRSVSAEAATLVSSMPYLVGYKPEEDLHYVDRGSKRMVHFIAIDPRGEMTAAKDLKAALIEVKYVSVLTQAPNGTYRYESRRKEVTLSERAIDLGAKGLSFNLQTDQPGQFAVVLRDASGRELSRVDYSVAGAADVSRSMERNAELQVKLDKNDYAPGEYIEVSIQAPYTGAGLITIERDRVYAHTWFKTHTTSSVQRIRLPAGIEGNAYLSVTFVRDIGSPEIYASPLSHGVAPFSISVEERRAEVSIEVPELVKPGEPLKIRYRSETPARIVLYAVDEGILQVAGYRTPDPLRWFFQKRALDVHTLQILDLILPEFRHALALAAPGGDAEAAIGRNLNPFKRKRDKPVAYWSGMLEAGPQTKEVTYVVPDYFNGSLRVMAVAAADDKVGVDEAKTLVRADLVLTPNVPSMVAPGDEFEVSLGVANNVGGSGADAKVAVELKTSEHLELVGSAKAALKIGEMREDSATFRLRARDRLGSASMSFSAGVGGKSGRISVDTSVRPAVPFMTTLTAGTVERGGRAEVKLTRSTYQEFAKTEASISSLPLGMAHGLVAYLGNFPYSCTEQLVSQGMPAVVLAKRPEFGQVSAQKGEGLARLIEVLGTRQNADGGFGLWSGTTNAHDFASVYAMHFLLEAKERGYSVPSYRFTKGNEWLQQLAASDGVTLWAERTRAYAIYVLTRQGVVTTNHAAALHKRIEERHAKEWRDDLTLVYLAAAYRLMKQDSLANGLIKDAQFVPARRRLWTYYYDDSVHNSVLLYVLSRHFPDRLKTVTPEVLYAFVRPLQEGSYNTLISAYTLLALDAYAEAISAPGAAGFSVQELLKDGRSRPVALPAGLAPRVAIGRDATGLRFANAEAPVGFYMSTEAGFDRAMPQQSIVKQLEIIREYTDAQGKPVSSVRLGEELEVHVKLRAVDRGAIDNLAVVDLLPGGFEVVMDRGPAPEEEMMAADPDQAPADEAAEEGHEGDEGEEESEEARAGAAWQPPFGTSKSTWSPEYGDVREDRVVLYGRAGTRVAEFVYRIKATNVGTYTVPPAFGEDMYDRSIQGRSLGGKITVTK